MNVVLLHDWLTGLRGGERVLEAFCEMFPNAPLYTLLHKKGTLPPSIEERKIVTSFLDRLPCVYRHYRKLLPLFPIAVKSMKIREKADLVLSSSHCVIKGLKKPRGAKHLCYLHSPMRYLYDQFHCYFGPHAPFYQRLAMKVFRRPLTRWDITSNQNVDVMVANAHFVRNRIQKYYQRDCHVVHPFVDLDDFKEKSLSPPCKKDFYLMVGAFAPNKRVDLAIEAFNQLPSRVLKIIGSGPCENELKLKARENIEFLGQLERHEVISHFFMAKAFILPGVEDFGITPLEALASGTPVIAREEGGVLESMNSKTAVFFKETTAEGLREAIISFEKKSFQEDDLFKRAQEFSKDRFKKEMYKKIEEAMAL